MPSNPNKETLRARRYIMEKINSAPPEGLDLLKLELIVLSSYAVGNSFTKRFIKEYYIDTGTHKINTEGKLIREAQQ